MKIKIYIYGWGHETCIGSIPKGAYKFINDNFAGDLWAFADACDEDSDTYGQIEIPEKYKFVTCSSDFIDCNDIYQAYGPGVASSYVEVENAETGDKLLEGEEMKNLTDDDPDDTITPELKRGQHVIYYQAEEKGNWSVWELDIKGKFDKKKLKFSYDTLWFNDEATSVITGMQYDGEFYDMNTDNLCTTGKNTSVELI